jgi:hypothetical protein
VRGEFPGCLKEKGVACMRGSSAYMLDGHRAKRAAHGTRRRRQGDGLALSQRVKECGVQSLARFRVRVRLVGSGRGHQGSARQVFDVSLISSARSRENDRKGTRTSERLGASRLTQGSLMARCLG